MIDKSSCITKFHVDVKLTVASESSLSDDDLEKITNGLSYYFGYRDEKLEIVDYEVVKRDIVGQIGEACARFKAIWNKTERKEQ